MVLQNPNKILRQVSEKVMLEKIKSAEIRNVIEEMKKELILSRKHDGVALAAPQIGYNLRIFIILEELLKLSKGILDDKELNSRSKKEEKFMVFINPEIIKKSKKTILAAEGCLSVNGMQGKIKRAEKVTVKALDEEGKEFKLSASKILSQAVQHEIDHLGGILFIDKAADLKKIESDDIASEGGDNIASEGNE